MKSFGGWIVAITLLILYILMSLSNQEYRKRWEQEQVKSAFYKEWVERLIK